MKIKSCIREDLFPERPGSGGVPHPCGTWGRRLVMTMMVLPGRGLASMILMVLPNPGDFTIPSRRLLLL